MGVEAADRGFVRVMISESDAVPYVLKYVKGTMPRGMEGAVVWLRFGRILDVRERVKCELELAERIRGRLKGVIKLIEWTEEGSAVVAWNSGEEGAVVMRRRLKLGECVELLELDPPVRVGLHPVRSEYGLQ